MSLEDPFFVVKEEVQKAIHSSQTLYERWNELINNPRAVSKEELEWTTSELRNSLRSIEWDLEDLEETVGIVEKNPRKFKIDLSELQERRNFIDRSKATVKDSKNEIKAFLYIQNMKAQLSSPKARGREETSVRQSLLNGQSKSYDKYTRLDQEMERSNQRYIEDTQQQQQTIIRTQDDHLDKIGSSIGALKNMSHSIGNELEEQNLIIDDFAHEMENTDSRLDTTMKKISKVMHLSNDRRQWCAILALLVILVIIIILFIVL